MTEQQTALLRKADESLAAARLLAEKGFADIAVSRAYYAMFYAASAMLLTLNLRFKKHSAVHAAFGHRIAQPGTLPVELHRWLADAAKARHASDYLDDSGVTPEEVATHIDHADRFLKEVGAALGRSRGSGS